MMGRKLMENCASLILRLKERKTLGIERQFFDKSLPIIARSASGKLKSPRNDKKWVPHATKSRVC